MRNSVLFAAASAALIAAVPASAAAAGTNTSTDFAVTVEHGDLNLADKQDVTRLDERLRTIIRQRCATGARDSQSLRMERQCRAEAFAAAEPQLRFAIAEANADKVRVAQGNPVAPQG